MAVQQAALDARRREGGNADRQRERLGRVRRIAAAEPAGEDPAGDGQAGVDVSARQDDREFVAADPERAVVAPQRAVTVRPTDFRSSSPLAWPRSSLTRLRSSTSISRSDSGEPPRTGHVELAGELFLERSMVSEAGQAVEQQILARLSVQLTQSRVLRRPAARCRAGAAEPGRRGRAGR